MKITREVRDARRAQIAAMVRDGAAPADVAAHFGISRWVMRKACAVNGVAVSLPRLGASEYVRSVHESMDEPQWAGICLYRRATAQACTAVATWQSGEVMACDAHREAMCCNVSVRRVRLEDWEAWA